MCNMGIWALDRRLGNIWKKMLQRCEDSRTESYHRYGGRGISVCAEWHDPMEFYRWAQSSGYCSTLTIDRRNNSLGYTPENCRWATSRTQCRNKDNNVLLTKDGVTKTVIEWAEERGIGASTLYNRVRRGMDMNRVLETPIRDQSARIYTFNGKAMTLAQWARYLGVPKMRLGHRLRRGWSIEEAFISE
jgi:hypothetical protein